MTDFLDENVVTDWLKSYQAAWEDQNAELVASLFTNDAEYIENPFEPIARGRDEIKAYWTEGAVNAQSDIHFDFAVWAIKSDIALAHWTAELTRVATGRILQLDGVFRLHFSDQSNSALCSRLEEWWFGNEVG